MTKKKQRCAYKYNIKVRPSDAKDILNRELLEEDNITRQERLVADHCSGTIRDSQGHSIMSF